jgi:hypothetical protein
MTIARGGDRRAGAPVSEILARAATAHHAARTRSVSAPRLAPTSGGREGSPPPGLRLPHAELSRKSKQVTRARIRRFESDMPSQAVQSLGDMSRPEGAGTEEGFHHYIGERVSAADGAKFGLGQFACLLARCGGGV